MRSPALALAASASPRRADPVRVAMERLSHSLPARADARVLVELLEDDVREGLDALGDVGAHFNGLLDTLRTEELSPVTLLEAGEDLRVLQQLDYLHDVLVQVRKRLSQAAALQRQGYVPTRLR
ncbi:hypothetical protein JY651_24285 [Pyxidicoccus parkwayensis]|uniref:Uncharacterized protein n=1 Tax=Pyxidicoccus parkwayensis TaxID=2813578 RepID=A0ABX7PBI0_9BACT|nr:hypothetical protein [Pyxidicoccus parkwaysis]QSQ27826.1 hypothetical protein JY651_24285 [Pyxidicoccus parkwaysis]